MFGLLIGQTVTQYMAGQAQAWMIVVSITLFVYVASLTVTLIDGIRWHAPLAVIWGACFALLLPWRTGLEVLALAGIVGVAAFIGYLTHRSAVAGYATLHTFSVVRQYASVLASGVVIALIVLYGGAVNRGSALLPQGILANVADSAAKLVPTFVPGLESNTSTGVSVRDLAMASAKSQLEGDERFASLTPEQQQQVLEAAAEQAAAAFAKQLGVTNKPDSSIGSVAQSAVSGFLAKFHDQYGWYFTIAWLLGAFFIARSAAVLLTFIVAGLVWLTISALLALGLLEVQSIPAIQEKLSIE